MKVFVDSSAWIALINGNDYLHEKAHDVMRELRLEKAILVTTEFVLLEVADALCSPCLRARTINYLETLRRVDAVRILPLSDALLQSGWSLYVQRADKGWGLTDCISFAAMSRENIARAFTSDAHFAQAGFQKLM